YLKKLTFNGSSLDSLVLESDSQKIVYKFYSTEQAAELAFKLAEIDTIQGLSSPHEFSQWNSLNIDVEVDNQQYAVIFLNVEDGNLAEKKVRQALAYAVPKLEDNSKRALGPLSRNSWAYNPNVKPYEYSLETARGLLEGLN